MYQGLKRRPTTHFNNMRVLELAAFAMTRLNEAVLAEAVPTIVNLGLVVFSITKGCNLLPIELVRTFDK